MKITIKLGVETPQLLFSKMLFFFLRVGKHSVDCLFKAVRSAGRGRGLGRMRKKRLENGKEEGRLKEIEKVVEKGCDCF